MLLVETWFMITLVPGADDLNKINKQSSEILISSLTKILNAATAIASFITQIALRSAHY